MDALSAHYGPDRLADYRRQFEKTTRSAGDDPSIFAIALETLAVKAFGDMGQTARLRLIRNRFIAGHSSCELRRYLDSVPPATPIQNGVDQCRVWESYADPEIRQVSKPRPELIYPAYVVDDSDNGVPQRQAQIYLRICCHINQLGLMSDTIFPISEFASHLLSSLLFSSAFSSLLPSLLLVSPHAAGKFIFFFQSWPWAPIVPVGEEANTQHNTLEFDITRLIPYNIWSPLVIILTFLGSFYNYICYVDIDITVQGLSTEA